MNTKEIGEIRRRVRRDRSNITTIYGCFVNGQKEIVSEFRQSVGMMPENESEKYFAMLKKVLSGGIGKNLIDISFRTSQVADSAEHKLLMSLRSDCLKEESVRTSFYEKVISSVSLEDNYVILLANDSYDVPFKSKDDTLQQDASSEVYRYIICAICPVKDAKPCLSYDAAQKEFHDGGIVQVMSAPELGFVFPAFDNRSANIYGALYYTHSPKENHQAFADAIFNVGIPKPAQEQKKSFEVLLGASLDDSCSMEVVQTVHEQLRECIAMHKESKVPEPLLISKELVKDALAACAVPEKNIAKFSVEYDEVFGTDAELHPKNIINENRLEIITPDVSIKVNPERSDLIETRVIGGVKYIMICADETVEVNGVPIQISDKETTLV